MTAMGEHQVAASVGFGVTAGAFGPLAAAHQGLEVVSHGVTKGAIAVPGLESEELAKFGVDELFGKGHAGIESTVIADLKDHASRAHGLGEFFTFLNRDPEWFLEEDRFTGGNGLPTKGNMKLVRGADNDRFDVLVGQHLIEAGKSHVRLMDRSHFLDQVFSYIADCVELGVACLA